MSNGLFAGGKFEPHNWLFLGLPGISEMGSDSIILGLHVT